MSEKKPVRYFRFSKKGREIVKRNRKKGPQRHIRPAFLIICACIIAAVVLIASVPSAVTKSRLKSLGYDSDTITAIREQNLTDTILDNSYYSTYLAEAIKNKTLNADYIQLYTVVPENYGLDDTSFLIYQRLADKGYESDQLLNLFSNLESFELIPLLVFDYQWDESEYIEECKEHHAENSTASLTLDSSFLTPYKVTSRAYNQDSVSVLVNARYGLDSSFVPSLQELSAQYASSGIQLTPEAASAFEAMSQAGVESGNSFFAADGYRSYEDQESIYQGCLTSLGSDAADYSCWRAGHDEQETGLAVMITPTYESYDDFEESNVHAWLSENAASYGFIERYPHAKADITGMDEPRQYRYVGTDLARKITDSQLSFDEYYCLYLKPWNNASLKPSDSILETTGAVDEVQEEVPETSD